MYRVGQQSGAWRDRVQWCWGRGAGAAWRQVSHQLADWWRRPSCPLLTTSPQCKVAWAVDLHGGSSSILDYLQVPLLGLAEGSQTVSRCIGKGEDCTADRFSG